MRKSLAAIIILFGLLIKAGSQSLAQAPGYTFTTGGSIFNGFVIKHDRYMGHLAQGMTHGFELDFNKNTYGNETWEQVFKYPDIGVSLSCFDYGSDILGQSLGLIAYSDFYLMRTRKFEGLFKIGAGFGFHNKPYDRETNNQNVAVGSPVTNSMQLRLGLNYKFTDRWKFTSALTITHFSLAAFTQPNKGINIVTANAGFTYRVSRSTPEYQPLDNNYMWSKALRYNANFYYGLKEIPPIGGPKYPVYELSFYVGKQVSKTNILTLGIDGFDNTALKAELERTNMDPGDYPDNKRIGITVGHELKLRKVAMITQLGIYIYRPYKVEKFIYQRYAIKYYITDKVYLHYGFLSHYAKASHGELGIGLCL